MKMLRLIFKALLTFMLFISFPLTTLADTETVNIEGGVIVENRTLIPMRALFEELGAKIDWNSHTKTVTAVKEDIVIKLVINSKTVTVNNQEITLDIAPQIIDSLTMVPVRFVSETLGANVNWKSDISTVVVEMDNKIINIKVEQVYKVSKEAILKLIETAEENYIRTIKADVEKIEQGKFTEQDRINSINYLKLYYDSDVIEQLLDYTYSNVFTEVWYLPLNVSIYKLDNAYIETATANEIVIKIRDVLDGYDLGVESVEEAKALYGNNLPYHNISYTLVKNNNNWVILDWNSDLYLE